MNDDIIILDKEFKMQLDWTVTGAQKCLWNE